MRAIEAFHAALANFSAGNVSVNAAASFDAGLTVWNDAVRRDGGPSNYFISPEQALVKSNLAYSLGLELRPAFASLEVDFNKARKAANVEPLKTAAEWQKPEPIPWHGDTAFARRSSELATRCDSEQRHQRR